jgi:hypothetical protein
MATAVTPEVSKEESTYIVFVQLNGLGPSTLWKGLIQFESIVSDNFNHLLLSVVQELIDSGQLDSSFASEILSYPVQVSHYPSKDAFINERISARLTSSCEALLFSNNRYVHFNFSPGLKSTTRKLPPLVNANSKLLQAQRQRFFPDKYIESDSHKHPYNLALYNHVVDCLQTGNFSVGMVHLLISKKLTRAIRDVLQHLDLRVAKHKIPSRFHHSLVRHQARDRTSQVRLKELRGSFMNAIVEAQCFLKTQRWKSFDEDVKTLMLALDEKITEMEKNSRRKLEFHKHSDDGLGDRLSDVFLSDGSAFAIEPRYAPLMALLQKSGYYNHILVEVNDIDKWHPPSASNETLQAARKRRQRFRDEILFNFPSGRFLFQPGGHLPSLLVVWQLPEVFQDRSETQNRDLHRRILSSLPRYHTRLVWDECRKKYGDLLGPGCPSGLLRRICRELTADSSTSTGDNDLEERVLRYVVSQGNPKFWPDLRAAVNGGKLQFEVFFEFAVEVVDELTGATPNRHGEQRVLATSIFPDMVSPSNSSLVSVPALIKRVHQKMLESADPKIHDALVPSQNIVRLAFCPQYPNRKLAESYRPRFELSRGIVRATMRKDNVDAHYNAKLNKFCNQFIVEFNNHLYLLQADRHRPTRDNHLVFSKAINKISVDDKAAVPIGEPGFPIRTNVRKFSSSIILERERNKESAGDHDWHRASVRPSMALFICTPLQPGESWRAGRVTCCLKDAATQHSTAMRHSVEFIRQTKSIVESDDQIHQQTTPNTPLPEMASMPYMFAMRSDGGSDRNPKHASVQIASLHTFLRLDLDALILLVTAADVSHVNEVEGVMPTVNLALQNQAFERQMMSPSMETTFKSANSGKTIRDVISNQIEDLDQAGHRLAWQQSMKQPLQMIASRITQVQYTRQNVQMFLPASDESLSDAYNFLKEKVDPNLDPNFSTWKDVRENNAFLCEYLASHTRVDRYHLEIFKCGDHRCKVCKPVSHKMSIYIWFQATIVISHELVPPTGSYAGIAVGGVEQASPADSSSNSPSIGQPDIE